MLKRYCKKFDATLTVTPYVSPAGPWSGTCTWTPNGTNDGGTLQFDRPKTAYCPDPGGDIIINSVTVTLDIDVKGCGDFSVTMSGTGCGYFIYPIAEVIIYDPGGTTILEMTGPGGDTPCGSGGPLGANPYGSDPSTSPAYFTPALCGSFVRVSINDSDQLCSDDASVTVVIAKV